MYREKAEIVKVLEKLDKGEVSPKLEKSPKAKKSPKPKKSPAKKAKKSPKAKKGKSPKKGKCYDKGGSCPENEVCDGESGRCVFDLVGLREGKYQLSVDGREIIGSRGAIESLQKVLGGEISKADSRPEERSEESSTDETYQQPSEESYESESVSSAEEESSSVEITPTPRSLQRAKRGSLRRNHSRGSLRRRALPSEKEPQEEPQKE